MKSIRFMLVLFAAIAAARAQDLGELKLADGRTFKGTKIVSASPLRITVRHEGGLAQIDKRDLPTDLLAKYPLDPAAHEKAEREIAARQIEATAKRGAEMQRLQEKRAADVAWRETEQAREEKEAAAATKKTREIAERGAIRWFETQWKPSNNEAYVDATNLRVLTVEKKTDYSGRWIFAGEAWLRYDLKLATRRSDQREGSRYVKFEGEVGRDGEVTVTEKL